MHKKTGFSTRRDYQGTLQHRVQVQKGKSELTYHVWALGRLLVLMSTWWMVNSLGPAAPVEPANTTSRSAAMAQK